VGTNKGPHGDADPLLKNNDQAAGAIPAKPEELHFTNWLAVVGSGFRVVRCSDSIPAKQFSIAQVMKRSGAFRIGALRQH